ncbi:hypothetical protein RUM43_003695 [Polyplax serrata]|uniref:Fatty acid desaturase domain-containing protein n=1 Tax=Polyplax serrata TaxID=468196 RepID=A0AAN8S6L0_POLSC
MSPKGFIEDVKTCSSVVDASVPTKSDTEKGAGVPETNIPFQPKLLWLNIISITLLHVVAVVSFFIWGLQTHPYTYLWGYVVGALGAFGVTAGAHRLWTHRSYKAKWPLRLLLVLCYSIAGQNSLYDWVRDHRVHHKFSETDADPHNSNRGFFFAHVGWLMQKKHPEVLRKGQHVDMSDLLEDPIVAFHQKHFSIFKMLLCFIIPIIVPCYFWNESVHISILGMGCVRYVLGLNFTWLVNSAAHMWGTKPYDSRICPVENLTVAILAFGEGWHNYHHVFPWDYKAAELGNYRFNATTMVLDGFQKIGWAYDAKEPSKELVQRVASKYGDGSHANCPIIHEIGENGLPVNDCEEMHED